MKIMKDKLNGLDVYRVDGASWYFQPKTETMETFEFDPDRGRYEEVPIQVITEVYVFVPTDNGFEQIALDNGAGYTWNDLTLEVIAEVALAFAVTQPDPRSRYSGYGDDIVEAISMALQTALSHGLTYEAAKGLSMDVRLKSAPDDGVVTCVDIAFCVDTTLTVMIWQPDPELERIVAGDKEAIRSLADDYDPGWVQISINAMEPLSKQWKFDYGIGMADIGHLVEICNKVDGSRNAAMIAAGCLEVGGINEDLLKEAYRRFIVPIDGDTDDSLVMVTWRGDGIVDRADGLEPVEWNEVEQAISACLAQTTDEADIGELKAMLAAAEGSYSARNL